MQKIKPYEKELLLKCLSGEATTEEMQFAWDWIHVNESHAAYYESLKESWISNAVNQEVSSQQMETSWNRIKNKIQKETPQKTAPKRPAIHGTFYVSMPWARLAAAIVFAFIFGGTGTFLYINLEKTMADASEYYTIEAPRGAKSRITLTDGSEVWLNAGSKLKYPKNFNQDNRNLYLEGEGYFVVAHNENIPFKVHASGLVVKALGTEFNVKAYPGEDRIETTLVKGSVSIIRNGQRDESDGVVLLPNQKASFFTDTHLVTETTTPAAETNLAMTDIITRPARVRVENNINTEVSTSWKEKRWVFEREKLGSLVLKLERHYDMEFVLENDELKEFHLSGTLEEESIEQVMQALQLTLPINYEVKHNKVYLSINPAKLNNYKQLLRKQNQ